MYTVTITYDDRTDIFHEVRKWKMQGRCFFIDFGLKHYKFLPMYKMIEIDIMRNNWK